MPEYCATERIAGVPHSRRFRADSWSDAEDTCAIRGWELDGELVCEIDADKTTPQQMHEFCTRANLGRME